MLQCSSLTLLEQEYYEEEVQPYWKTDYKPIIYIRTDERDTIHQTSQHCKTNDDRKG